MKLIDIKLCLNDSCQYALISQFKIVYVAVIPSPYGDRGKE